MYTRMFEDMLAKYQPNKRAAGDSWDRMAKRFDHARAPKGGADEAEAAAGRLLARGLLAGREVLDVGGGTGRYAIPFAVHAKTVTVADISERMLAIARQNAVSAGYENLEYVKLDWNEADPETLGWTEKFDLVFASMCPAIMSSRGIEKMCEASKGWCQINQLIEMTDDISRKLTADLEIKPFPDVHNNRDITQALFNLIWLTGHEPEITYQKTVEEHDVSVDDALERFSFKFAKTAAAKGADLRNLLESYADNGRVRYANRITLSMILWQI